MPKKIYKRKKPKKKKEKIEKQLYIE